MCGRSQLLPPLWESRLYLVFLLFSEDFLLISICWQERNQVLPFLFVSKPFSFSFHLLELKYEKCLLGIEFLAVSSSHLYPSALSLTCSISHKCAIKFPFDLACDPSFRSWCYNNRFQVISGLQQFDCDMSLCVCFLFLQKIKLLYRKKFTVFSNLEKFLSLVFQYYHVC